MPRDPDCVTSEIDRILVEKFGVSDDALASAVAAGVDVLVSGDRDVLDNVQLCPVRVLNPRAFREVVRGAAS